MKNSKHRVEHSANRAIGWWQAFARRQGPGAWYSRSASKPAGNAEKRLRGAGFEQLEPRRLLSVTINWGTTEQTIAGFGASSAWDFPSVTSSQAQLLWSPSNGAGLTLLRTKINEDGNASDSLANIDNVTMLGKQYGGNGLWPQ